MFEIEHLSMSFFRFVVLISLIKLHLVHNLLAQISTDKNNTNKTNINKRSAVQ